MTQVEVFTKTFSVSTEKEETLSALINKFAKEHGAVPVFIAQTNFNVGMREVSNVDHYEVVSKGRIVATVIFHRAKMVKV
jgi:hypothetical protein